MELIDTVFFVYRVLELLIFLYNGQRQQPTSNWTLLRILRHEPISGETMKDIVKEFNPRQKKRNDNDEKEDNNRYKQMCIAYVNQRPTDHNGSPERTA